MIEKMNCYDFAMKFAFAKEITFKLITHYKNTELEKVETLSCGEFPDYSVRVYEVVMCKANKKNHFTVYGYREV